MNKSAVDSKDQQPKAEESENKIGRRVSFKLDEKPRERRTLGQQGRRCDRTAGRCYVYQKRIFHFELFHYFFNFKNLL